MPINNFAGLKTAVYSWLLRDSTNDLVITNDRVEEYIELCEAELSRELKIRTLEAENDSLETSISSPAIALPDDFRQMILLEFDGAPKPLEYISEVQMSRLYPAGEAGRPRNYTIQGNNIRFAPVPDAVYGLYLRYYKKISALSDSNTTNDILTKYPDAYLYGTLKQALININDQTRLQTVVAIYDGVINRIKEEDKNSQVPTGARARRGNRLV